MFISPETYLAYIATVLVFFAHPPGPGQLLFMANSMKFGVRRALPVIAGNHGANVIQMLLAGFGLVGTIAASADLFLIVKWLGVAYLLWLGIATIRRGKSRRDLRKADRTSSLVRQGFVTAAANPYAVMFFAALFPQFIDPAAPIGPQILILGATYLVIDGLILLAMGASASRLLTLLGERALSVMNRVSGALMVLAAGLLALRGFEPEAKP